MKFSLVQRERWIYLRITGAEASKILAWAEDALFIDLRHDLMRHGRRYGYAFKPEADGASIAFDPSPDTPDMEDELRDAVRLALVGAGLEEEAAPVVELEPPPDIADLEATEARLKTKVKVPHGFERQADGKIKKKPKGDAPTLRAIRGVDKASDAE